VERERGKEGVREREREREGERERERRREGGRKKKYYKYLSFSIELLKNN
jgi:hypothetical protein